MADKPTTSYALAIEAGVPEADVILVLQAFHTLSPNPAVWREIDHILAKDRTQFDGARWEVERKARLTRQAISPSARDAADC